MGIGEDAASCEIAEGSEFGLAMKKGTKLLRFDGKVIAVFNANVKAVQARTQDADTHADKIFALMENMSDDVLAVVAPWSSEDGIEFDGFVARVRDHFSPRVPRAALIRAVQGTKPSALEKPKAYLSRLVSIVEQNGYVAPRRGDDLGEWSLVKERIYSALLMPVAGSLPPGYYTEPNDRTAALALIDHLEARTRGTGARIWYTPGDGASSRAVDTFRHAEAAGPSVQNRPVKQERGSKDYVLKRLVGAISQVIADDTEPDEEGAWESVAALGPMRDGSGSLGPTCEYCGKRGHTQGLCLQRLADAVDRLEKKVNSKGF